MGLALSGGLRLGNRHRRTRAILVPFGLNLAALGFLAAVLASGSELGLLPGRWLSWLVPAGACAVAGLLVFRFPRSVGLPVLALVAVLTWYSTEALADFAVLDPLKTSLSLQPLTDRDVSAGQPAIDVQVATAWNPGAVAPPQAQSRPR